MNYDRFQYTETEMTCPECGKGEDECPRAHYADAECVEAEVEREEQAYIKEEMRGAA